MKKLIAFVLSLVLFVSAAPCAMAAQYHSYEDLQKLYDTVVNYVFKTEDTLKRILTDEEDEFCAVPMLAAKELLLSGEAYTDEDTTYAYNGLYDTLSMLILIVQRDGSLTSDATLNILKAVSDTIYDENYTVVAGEDAAKAARERKAQIMALISNRGNVTADEFSAEINKYYYELYDAAKLKINYCNSFFSVMEFTDVKKNDWFYDAIDYVYKNDLFKGTSKTTFSPNELMTRAMFITVLMRAAKVEDAAADEAFSDVRTEEYFAAPVSWAKKNGILDWVAGDTFEPHKPITREEMLACMYAYAKSINFDSPSYDMSLADRITDLEDADENFREALSWGFSVGVITGYGDDSIKPKNTATRAEVAQVFINLKLVLGN